MADGGPSPKQSTIWVLVQVLDENDNKPQFPEKVYQIRLPERDRKKRGEPIYRAFAFDRDEGPNAEISYSIADGNEDGKFFIDPKTGLVSSRKQFTAGSYDILTVRARPGSPFRRGCPGGGPLRRGWPSRLSLPVRGALPAAPRDQLNARDPEK